MFNSVHSDATTRTQIDDTDDSVMRFAVVTRHPDEDVHPSDRPWWIEREERLEIHDELAANGLL